jgi:hypothetical protein
MLSHTVYFTLTDSSDDACTTLVNACKKYLSSHAGTAFFAAGTLEDNLDRPVNDRDFHVVLHVIFESRQAHDDYQVADLHNQFIEENKGNWAKVRVFDANVSQ